MNKPPIWVVQTERFEKDLKRLRKKYPRVDRDVLSLIERLEDGETPGDRVPGVPYRVYKERLANTSARRGERGGFRTIYYVQTTTFVLLITIYSKSERSDIRPELIRQIIEEQAFSPTLMNACSSTRCKATRRSSHGRTRSTCHGRWSITCSPAGSRRKRRRWSRTRVEAGDLKNPTFSWQTTVASGGWAVETEHEGAARLPYP